MQTTKQFIESHAGWDADNWSQADLDELRDFVKRKETTEIDFADAYAGAREDLAIWKNRALAAEAPKRIDAITDDQIIEMFQKIAGGKFGAWSMYKSELVAFFRAALEHLTTTNQSLMAEVEEQQALIAQFKTARSVHADYKCQNEACGNVFNLFVASTGCPACDSEAVAHQVPEFSSAPPCGLCGGPYQFDTTIPSDVWNRVIREEGLPDYLCTNCILKKFITSGNDFTATLWGESLNGVGINVSIKSKG